MEVEAKFRAPPAVRYIKLGKNGVWAEQAFRDGTIPFGFSQVDDAPCAAGNWAAVRAELIAAGRSATGATQGVRELQDFYTLDEAALWVTFADGHLWWAFAAPAVMLAEGGDGPTRYRQTLGGWRRHSLTGESLTIRSLSSALTKVAGYRMTICSVERQDYLLRRIRGEREPLQLEADAAKAAIQSLTLRMIAQLDWRDFEIMVDLMFARGGWQRSSAIGEGEIDVDLMLNSPTTGETAWVQIKSAASQAILDDYIERFRRDGSCDRLFFVCHTPKGVMSIGKAPDLHLWTDLALADATLQAGLFDWLVIRSR